MQYRRFADSGVRLCSVRRVEAEGNNGTAVVQPGEKIFVVHRPLVQGYVRRHFIRTVLAREF